MAKKIVCVRDAKTEVFGTITPVVNLAEAERMFSDLVNDSSTLVGKHCDDFALYCIGDYDETLGVIVPCDPFCVCKGAEVRSLHGLS